MSATDPMPGETGTAVVAGASGIVGQTLARHLLDRGWTVHGLARRPPTDIDGLRPLPADLRDAAGLATAVAGVQPDAVFLAFWMRQDTEAENIRVNAGAVRNLLDALRPAASVRHVALVTGLKHYLGPFESYGQGGLPDTPFREEQGRLPIENFYYAQEDAVFAASGQDGFGWSVHRPHTIIGYAVGNAMNMGVTLAVYAAICRARGLPFRFPGSATQWRGLTDMTDAGLLARHLEWATLTPGARNEAFNVVNGDVFRWQWLWPRLARALGVDPAPFEGEHGTPLAEQLADAAPSWRTLAERFRLVEPELDRVASAWHTDADLGRPIEVVTDMSKSRRLGFTVYQPTEDAFLALFDRLRAARVIPPA